MKLELKHIAPYEYLKLKVQCIDKTDKRFNSIFTLTQFHKRKHLGFLAVCGYNSFYSHEFKPILRPLSDLIKEIEVNGKKFYPCHKFGLIESKQNQVHLERKIHQQYISHLEITILIEWHFDVFGLIPAGLAIDINTLNKEQ